MDRLSSMKASIVSYLPTQRPNLPSLPLLPSTSTMKAYSSWAAGHIWTGVKGSCKFIWMAINGAGIPGIAGGLATGFAYNLLTGAESINDNPDHTGVEGVYFKFNEANEICILTGWAMHVFSHISKASFKNPLLQTASTITGCAILAANALSSHPAIYQKFFPISNEPQEEKISYYIPSIPSIPSIPCLGRIRDSSARAVGILLVGGVALLSPKISKTPFIVHMFAGLFFGFGVNYLEGKNIFYQNDEEQTIFSFHLNSMNELFTATGLAMGLWSNTSSLVGRILNNQPLATTFRISGYLILAANALCSKYPDIISILNKNYYQPKQGETFLETSNSSNIRSVSLFGTRTCGINIRPETARAGGIMLVGIVIQLLAARILSPQKV